LISIHRRLYNGINRLLQRSNSKTTDKQPKVSVPTDLATAHIIPRAQHPISRQHIHRYAIKVLYRLKEGGYESYLVGGGVRDLLLGITPKDFDVATNARPEQVDKLFRNCRLIGRRFRLAHIHFGRYIIEVATFRANKEKPDHHVSKEGRILRDNHYGNLEEDAERRDFTINALYYNIADFTLVDYCDGLADIEARLIRLIGDPVQRYQEDPVRMLRALRFSAKLDFDIEAKTQAPIRKLGNLLQDIPPSRLFEEVLKIFLSGYGRKSFILLEHYGLLTYLFAPSCGLLKQAAYRDFVLQALENSDQRIADGKPVISAFLFAVLLWPAVDQRRLPSDSEPNPYNALIQAAHDVSQQQNSSVHIPKRTAQTMREIWQLQLRLEQMPGGKRAKQTVHHQRFRAAFDFLILRVSLQPELQATVDYWQQQQDQMPAINTAEHNPDDHPKPKRHFRRRHKPAKTPTP